MPGDSLHSAARLRVAATSFPWLAFQTLLALEALFQFTEDGVSCLVCVLVEVLTVLGLIMTFQVVLFQHRHDFFAY